MTDNKRFRDGKWATIAWLGIWIIIVAISWGEAKQLPLNAWGDLMAGIVGPVALLWLVLGYLQQGDELRQNTEALTLQQRELHVSAQATLELAQSSTHELKLQTRKLELESRPIFSSSPNYDVTLGVALGGTTHGLPRLSSIILKNDGAPVTGLFVTLMEEGLNSSEIKQIDERTYEVNFAPVDSVVRDQLLEKLKLMRFPAMVMITYYDKHHLKKHAVGELTEWGSLTIKHESGEEFFSDEVATNGDD